MSREEQKSNFSQLMAAMVFLAVLLGGYVGGYFWLGEWHTLTTRGGSPAVWFHLRYFPHPLLVRLYKPAGVVEQWCRGEDVYIEEMPTSWLE
jgi:hypothetical protein